MSRIIENPRELILNEAKKILYNEGYSNVSIRRVARECNIAVGTIYNYFPTKKELIIDMMENFWKKYFNNIEIIINSNENFYVKLRNIFNELSRFMKKFKGVWLNNKIYSSPDYIESGLKRQDIYIDKLIMVIEELIKKDIHDYERKKCNVHKMAKFIIVNFIGMIQMPYSDYDFFESLLKKLI